MQTPRGPGTKWKKGEKEELLAGEAGKGGENWGTWPSQSSDPTETSNQVWACSPLHSSPPTNCSFTLCPGDGASEHRSGDRGLKGRVRHQLALAREWRSAAGP